MYVHRCHNFSKYALPAKVCRRRIKHTTLCIAPTLVPRGRSMSDATRTAAACSSVCTTQLRRFGNAPTRVRPVEIDFASSARQNEFEVSPMIILAFLVLFPLWVLSLEGVSKQREKQAMLSWAERWHERR